jgi:ubiquitin carboxyl-terminal hydrolase 16/45
VLATLGHKYDQYLDFRQQDAHEFLRLLLDAMRMEELDVRERPIPFILLLLLSDLISIR